jgi:hypothetical protein
LSSLMFLLALIFTNWIFSAGSCLGKAFYAL